MAEFPSDAEAPLFGIELDRLYSQPALGANRTLIIGQMLTGTGSAAVPYAVRDADEVALRFGRGSQIHRAAKRFFQGHPTAAVVAIGLSASGSGGFSTWTATFTGPASADGTFTVYDGGQRIETAVLDEDTATEVATAFETAWNLNPERNFNATRSTAVVTLTARCKGIVGNVPVRQEHFGLELGEETPAGIGVTWEQTVVGSGQPAIATAFAGLGADDAFRYILFPWHNTTTLDAVQAEMVDRWSPIRGVRGHAFTGLIGTHTDLVAAGDARTIDSHISFAGFEPTSASPEYELTAAALAQIIKQADENAGYTAKGQQLAGGSDPNDQLLGAPATGGRFTWAERDLLYAAGVNPVVHRGNATFCERSKTLYKLNPATGLPDKKFKELQTLLILCEVIDRMHAAIAAAYPNHTLVDDGVPVKAGLRIVRPADIGAKVLEVYQRAEFEALVRDLDWFKGVLTAVKDPDSSTRVNFLAPIKVTAPLYHVAGVVQVLT